MRKAFKKAFQELKDVVDGKENRHDQFESVPFPPQGSGSLGPDVALQQSTAVWPRPTPQDIIRYRYQHGTNLGAIFVLEQWLFGRMYDENVSSGSELDAVVASINNRGLLETRQKWESHWHRALTDADLHWLTHTAHCNHIRLPIGYFTLGPAFCTNTPFGLPVNSTPSSTSTTPAEVYVNAWTAVKELIRRCIAVGIGVLIDFHAVPGGANHETHSGTSTGRASLWGNSDNLALATRCLSFMATEVTRDPGLAAGVMGIQVCNESIIDPPGMYEWYNEVIQRMSAIDPTLPIYLSDGWDLGRAVRFTRAYNNTDTNTATGHKCPVVVDCHKYWTFDEKDTSRSAGEIIEQIKTQELHELEDPNLTGDVFAHQAAVGVYIGEYSMALAPQTWDRSGAGAGTDPNGTVKDNLMRQFGNEQSRKWQHRATGSAFWTFKMDWMPGWEWGFKHATENKYITAPRVLGYTVREVREKLMLADQRKGQLLDDAVAGHTAYWDSLQQKNQGGASVASPRFEHWRYADGWNQGWSDARDFFAARVDGYVPSLLGGAGIGGSADTSGMPVRPEPISLDDGPDLPVGADLVGGALDLWILRRMRAEGMTDHQTYPFGWEWEHGFRAGMRSFGEVVG
ncbi:hypothetical protein A1O1_01029 [Capronia coronata CBS 617.96]|uniref:Glycoside hydrolase family 5 domain-containing protein n=1 Tax=Capronia coronata CBS 617.96 TaxID=1182541 RepID=W9ZN63_9EURO|nr:uncharacterized protein A1O1_01029 [Capronia coronata CBS 617.96]EXJ95904.1 hypothetical protein A1O1_01029 [Capronia coronata CBS 617.96]